MRNPIAVVFLVFCFSAAFSQKTKVAPKKYPSLLWEITGKGLKKPSYLFGTMHVSSKMAFHLSDSFYFGIKNADVVALETDMGSWQEDFSRYNLAGEGSYNYFSGFRDGYNAPSDYLTIGTLQFRPYEKMIEAALYSSPSIINNFLYRSNNERAADFEEDTYLDMHIYQAGKKWGKKVCGVENFDESMQLMKEAYLDAAKEKNKKEKSFDFDEDFSYNKMEEAYRTGNLDLLDTINKINSSSAAFDEKFMYRRNEIQANSIDSILKTKQSLFVGVGAAHLPGQRGVIEMLRQMGYKLRPIKMTERDSRHKDEVEKIRVPVQFSKHQSPDGLFSVNLPGKLYDFSSVYGLGDQQQHADMSNGSYYMVTRIHTNSILWGHSEDMVLRKIDSVIYENIPGKILTKEKITRNGFKGLAVMNRTRRGDYQRYNIFVTPFEIILFKMSGNGEYVKEGKEADLFFNSIEFREYAVSWQKWSPAFGGFTAEFPHQPRMLKYKGNWQFMAVDKSTTTGFEIIRTDVHNYDFVEEDSFDLNLMDESFAASEFIDKQLSRRHTRHNGYPALDARYRYKDGSTAQVRFLIQGTHYYTIIAHSKKENSSMARFVNSFSVSPFVYPKPSVQKDTSLLFTVHSSVPLEKPKKMSTMPDAMEMYAAGLDDETELEEKTLYRTKLVANDSTGEKIYISFSRPSRYHFEKDSMRTSDDDSTHFKTDRMDWVYRLKKRYRHGNNDVFEYKVGDPKSSRYVWGKLIERDGISYRLETQADTISEKSPFLTAFFSSFEPVDTVRGNNVNEKKSALFFQDFFSRDSSAHKRAVRNLGSVYFDSTDLGQLKSAINSLTWAEKKYMDVKKAFLWQLSNLKNRAASDFLKDVYYAAGDTVELQYASLEALLQQKTAYSFGVFKDIMVTDPPVIALKGGTDDYRPSRRTMSKWYPPRNTPAYDYAFENDYNSIGSENFLDGLMDTVQLTNTIFRELLPLININDYEQPMMELLGRLIDSNLVTAKDFEIYMSKFLIEAKQQWKKQLISEKNRSIEKAREIASGELTDEDLDQPQDFGNRQLSLYATLLMPFWDKNPAVPQLINNMLTSTDSRLKYNTLQLLLRNNKPVPDTMIRFFAALDQYRYELFTELKDMGKMKLFPEAHLNHIALARSELINLGTYDNPDTIVYLDRIPVQQHERSGFVYFFKYKLKKDDNSWKLASVGLVPEDPKEYSFERKERYYEEMQFDFTDMGNTKLDEETPLKEQLQKALKKMLYSKRNSAAEFYTDDERGGYDFLRNVNFGD